MSLLMCLFVFVSRCSMDWRGMRKLAEEYDGYLNQEALFVVH